MQDKISDAIKKAKLEDQLRVFAPGSYIRQLLEAPPQAVYKALGRALGETKVSIRTFWPKMGKTKDWSVTVAGTPIAAGTTDEEAMVCTIVTRSTTKVGAVTLKGGA